MISTEMPPTPPEPATPEPAPAPPRKRRRRRRRPPTLEELYEAGDVDGIWNLISGFKGNCYDRQMGLHALRALFEAESFSRPTVFVRCTFRG